jgi:transcriptional regulator with XRE-family HTH domain
MARAALQWSNADLAARASVGVNTVSRFEQGGDVRQSSVAALTNALEAAGIIFIPAGAGSSEGGEGIRLTA